MQSNLHSFFTPPASSDDRKEESNPSTDEEPEVETEEQLVDNNPKRKKHTSEDDEIPSDLATTKNHSPCQPKLTQFPSHIIAGGHRLEGGQSTPAMDILDKAGEDTNTKNPLLPESAQEFRAMLDIVMYDPQRFTFHDHMLDAIVKVQSRHYPYIRRVLSDVINGGETAEEITRRTTNTDIPCLIIWGRDDKICHPSGAKLAKKLKPQTKVILLNECGHCISVDRPGKTARFITRFINKQSCVL